jgi:hypothetical protein
VGSIAGTPISFVVIPALTFQLTNASRPGSPFVAGDTWQVTITGGPNQPVAVAGTTNGSAWGPVAMGQTDASGHFTKTGTIGATGNYTETWTAGGVTAGTVTFTVNPVPTVQISNVTHPGSTTFAVGDTWKVTISGAANQAVTVTGTTNGNPWGPVAMGQTDNTGNFSRTGVIAANGSYTEIWSLGGVMAIPAISFTAN